MIEAIWTTITGIFEAFFRSILENALWAVILLGFSIVTAAGRTVQEGQRGLFFTLGRVRRVVDEGFYLMVPFFQTIRIVSTRHRTLDLENQRIVTTDGLAYRVDVNLVYRVEDPEKALIEISELTKGLRDALTISVHELLITLDRSSFKTPESLGERLATALQPRCSPWGVKVIEAELSSITPADSTRRVLQLGGLTQERRRFLELARERGLAPEVALSLQGTRSLPRSRQARAASEELLWRRRRKAAGGLRPALISRRAPVTGPAVLDDDAPVTPPRVPGAARA